MDKDKSENENNASTSDFSPEEASEYEETNKQPFFEDVLVDMNNTLNETNVQSEDDAKAYFFQSRNRFSQPEYRQELSYQPFGKKSKLSLDSVLQSKKSLNGGEKRVNGATSRGVDDEHTDSSETELDAFCNQSESIEADQYKMDPEVDQVKDGDMHEPISASRKTSNELQLIYTSSSPSLRTESDTVVPRPEYDSSAAAASRSQKVYSHPAMADGVKLLFNLDKEVDEARLPQSEGVDAIEKMQALPSNATNENLEVIHERKSNFLCVPRTDGAENAIEDDLKFLKLDNPEDEIKGMRRELEQLLKLSKKHIPDRELYNEATEAQEVPSAPRNPAHSCEGTVAIKCREMLPFTLEYLADSFPGADSLEHKNRPDLVSHLTAENKVLRLSVEEETIKRKHCEKVIAHLNKKVIDLQQTTAFIISLDTMKDDVIKSFDKMLSKIAERWKANDNERLSAMERAFDENRSMKNTIKKQKLAISNSEARIHDLLSKMNEQKEWNERENRELSKQVREGLEKVALVQEERDKELNSMRKKVEDEKMSRSKMEMELHEKLFNSQSTFELEKLKWKSKESKLEAELKALIEDCSEKVDLEKMRNQKLQNIIEELNMSINQLKNDKASLETNLRELKAEKEHFRNAAETLEDKYKQQYNEMHKELAIKTRNEVAEVTQKLMELHKWEMEELMRNHMEEMESVKMKYNARCNEAMKSLSQAADEVKRLKEENEVLNGFRREAARKMQNMMKLHQEEALRLFGIESAASKSRGDGSHHRHHEEEGGGVPQKSSPLDSHDYFSEQQRQEYFAELGEGEADRSLDSFLPLSAAVGRTSNKDGDFVSRPRQHDASGGHPKPDRKNKMERRPNAIPGRTSAPSSNSANRLMDAMKSLKSADKRSDPQNTPPVRLQSLTGNPSTFNNNNRSNNEEEEEEEDQRAGTYIKDNNNNAERCNALRQYIQRMLQQEVNKPVSDSQNVSFISKKT